MRFRTVPSITVYDFSFTGTAREYFGIWIVNLLLTILTLGIFSAWAKVRRLRYFYGNTQLDGHNFEFHADPVRILKGRIIVVVAIAANYVVQYLMPSASFLLLIPYLIGLPFLYNLSMRFNARMTSYRNVKFGFVGSYWRAAWALVLYPTLLITAAVFAIIALWLGDPFVYADSLPQAEMITPTTVAALTVLVLHIFPLISKASTGYIGQNLTVGRLRFFARPRLVLFVRNLWVAITIGFIVALVIAVGMLSVDQASSAPFGSSGSSSGQPEWWDTLFLFAVYAGGMTGYTSYRIGVRNIAYNAAAADFTYHLISRVGRWRYCYIMITNVLVIVLTLGLLRPWAAIRTYRYLVSCTAVRSSVSLAEIVGIQDADGSAVAAEYTDVADLDFGF